MGKNQQRSINNHHLNYSNVPNHNTTNGDTMIKELKKGNKAPYKGYLLGIHEYQDYQKLKELVPKFMKELQEIKEA